MRDFQTSHMKAFQLEQAIQDERFNFMTEYEKGASSDWFINRAKYILELSNELKQETDKLHSILAEVEQNTVFIEEEKEKETEITENVNDSPLTTCEDDSYEVNSSYNESICTEQSFQTVQRATTVMARISGKDQSGYKYGGKGFKVFTGNKNQCKPIYGTTLLVCRGHKDADSKTLRKDLIDNGRFSKSQILSISAGRWNYEYHNYALIEVRAPFQSIKNKIRQLNKSKSNVNIFIKEDDNIASNKNKNNVLFVSNFDITNKQMHKRFTKLFLKYGALAKDIQMGMDKNCDPFAIVHFRHLDDAQQCVEAQQCDEEKNWLRFGGKKLSVNYSKYSE